MFASKVTTIFHCSKEKIENITTKPYKIRGILMKAIICTKYGPPEVLQLKEVEKPAPRDNEVLIKVFTTTVTRGDSRMRSFTVPIFMWLPARIYLGIRKPKRAILGMSLAGEIESVGKNVTKFKNSDLVFASTFGENFGGYAEYKSCQKMEWYL